MVQQTAEGTFEVTAKPVEDIDPLFGATSLHKVFSGEMTGTSIGQMLGVRTAVEGSAGYVAIERVTATLGGQHGSFVLQHSGTVKRGDFTMKITVIPDSGTEGLTGLTGSMTIAQRQGVHHYVFHYVRAS